MKSVTSYFGHRKFRYAQVHSHLMENEKNHIRILFIPRGEREGKKENFLNKFHNANKK